MAVVPRFNLMICDGFVRPATLDVHAEEIKDIQWF